jgi:dipeptidyl aminopeptidase/acylaminoacyl peptidase
MSFSISVVLSLFLVFSGQLRAQDPVHQLTGPFSGRRFTVTDSIEMARFERGDGELKFSPDKKYFAVVTTRGLLPSNEIESTLWVFQSEQAREVLRTNGTTRQCGPRILAKMAAIPQLEYPGSYEPLITDLRWMADSKAILFLRQNSRGERQLLKADINSGTVRAFTSEHYDVTRFELRGSHIAYVAVPPRERRTAGEPINSAARDVTGVTLTSILFPDIANDQRPSELWVLHKEKSRRMIDPSTGQPVRLAKFPLGRFSVLSLSADGQAAVVLTPTMTIPLSWESYEPALAYLKLHSGDTHGAADSRAAQYAVVDLNSGKVTPLVNAPNGWALGSGDMNQVAWSFDGKELLLTNTFLPLESVDEAERQRRLQHCVAAIVELASQQSSCVVFSIYDRSKKQLTAASFGESGKEVVLRFWNAPNTTSEERYRYENGAWQPVNDHSTGEKHEALGRQDSEADSATFSVAIKQDLNAPPALWVIDRERRRSKKIWDPNPHLAAFNLGEASEFHWKDSTGYEWVGGLVKPPDYAPGKRYPLVIQTHGFQASEFITDGAYTTAFAARPLASAGIVVLQMPTRHDRLVSGDEAPEQIEGFESAIDSLAADGLIDPEKVGIIGFSRTCYYVESALIRDPNRFAAATLADGVDESYMQYLLFGVGQSHDEEVQIYGSRPFGDGLKKWVEHAPGFHLDRVRTPIRIEAISPPSVLAEWELYASLSKQGRSVDLIYSPNGQHILQKPLERLASQQGNVDWFRFWLKGEEDTEPAKAKQYTLWRRLRNQRIAKD